MLRLICLVLASLVLTGCKTWPVSIDTRPQQTNVDKILVSEIQVLADLQLEKKSDDWLEETLGVEGEPFGDLLRPNDAQILRSLIESYFDSRFQIDPSSQKKIVVTISIADATHRMVSASWIPYVGPIIATGVEHDYLCRLAFSVSVIGDQSSNDDFLFDQTVQTKGWIGTEKRLNESYQNLFNQQKERISSVLDNDFLPLLVD